MSSRSDLRRSITGGAVLALALALGGAAAVPLAHAEPAEPATTPATNPKVRQVLAISVDGLNPQAIRQLGAAGTPTLHRLMAEGVSTLNARTEYERTETLPNHTGMITGLRIRAGQGGHGVEWNDDRLRPRTVQQAAKRSVPSIFSAIRASGRGSAVFASKTKFTLWKRSWSTSFKKFVVNTDNKALVKAVTKDLGTRRAFRFVHLSDPDVVGHRMGYLSPAYLRQVQRTDALLGSLVTAVQAKQPDTLVILTSDHGGRGTNHADATKKVNYTIPFIVWGPGIAPGDLYDLNPTYADPGTTRVKYSKTRQPVRNGDVANLALDLLGLPALKKSEHDRAQDLLVVGS